MELLLYSVQPDHVNLYAVFGSLFGVYLLINIEAVVREAVTFVKGWNV